MIPASCCQLALVYHDYSRILLTVETLNNQPSHSPLYKASTGRPQSGLSFPNPSRRPRWCLCLEPRRTSASWDPPAGRGAALPPCYPGNPADAQTLLSATNGQTEGMRQIYTTAFRQTALSPGHKSILWDLHQWQGSQEVCLASSPFLSLSTSFQVYRLLPSPALCNTQVHTQLLKRYGLVESVYPAYLYSPFHMFTSMKQVYMVPECSTTSPFTHPAKCRTIAALTVFSLKSEISSQARSVILPPNQ